ncbi:nucleotidyltransferase domain-containing protein [Fodinibius sp.]|uniref:nucleotidyltransferase domain-containing protein n=1 Tax=Fodinibius sp. TaxID=1872440 RepID=UPI002ACDAD59|nr:nucleotidyltransferase domain-containing protein [Fodinibius sp.]MDZ7657993.1 nucleotidyltransferase domain-containing protein [Fodinibius sp.]
MKADTRKETEQKIKDFFRPKDEVIFVYLFGSFVNKERYRDIDVAVYMDSIPDLISQGEMQSALDELFEINIDLVILNELPNKNPVFVYEILSKGKAVLNKNADIHTVYKSKAYQHYFDTAYLRKQFQDAFEKRMKTKKFGERDYE